MSERFSILKCINLDVLEDKIDEYVRKNNESPYIFMNEDTADAIAYTYEVIPHTHRNVTYKNGIVGRYCGYKVFLDNDLKLGEIEIR